MRNRRNALGTEFPQALEGSVEALLLDFPWAQREVERARIGKAQAADLGSRGKISRAVAAELARLAKLANSFVAIFRRTRSRLYRNRFLQVMFQENLETSPRKTAKLGNARCKRVCKSCRSQSILKNEPTLAI